MKILVVDDDAPLNRMLSRYLEKSGFEVHSAGDGLQALDVLERIEGIGMVVADLMMPHVDGLSFLRLLKADARHQHLPVIVVTDHPDDKKAEQALREGAAFLLPKPLDFDGLLALLKFAE